MHLEFTIRVFLIFRNKFGRKQSSSEEEYKNEVFHSDDNLSDFDKYGKTPPRTRILRRTRERNKKEKAIMG